MIDLNDLSHWAKVKRKSEASGRDEYTGKKKETEKTIEVRCFFDESTRSVKYGQVAKKSAVDGILFLAPDTGIQENDIVTEITDTLGAYLSMTPLKVTGLHRFNEPSGIHHIEATLVKDANS